MRIKGLGWKPDTPDHRDQFHRPKLAEVPPHVDLRDQFKFDPFDQGDLGSCTANAISAMLVFVEQKQQEAQPLTPSRLAIYWGERDLENSVAEDSGAEIRDGLKVVANQGYIDESVWPYDILKFTQKPPDYGPNPAKVSLYQRVGQTRLEMLSCLAEGFPFVFGISVYASFMSAKSGEIPMPNPGEALEGGHAILCMGYDLASERFIFLNSWGKGWGNAGYGTIPIAYLVSPEYGGDYWTVRQET